MNEVPHTIKTDVKPTIINLPKEEGIFNNAINTINTEIPPITNARKRTSLVYFSRWEIITFFSIIHRNKQYD